MSDFQIAQFRIDVYKSGCILKVRKKEELFDDINCFVITRSGKDIEDCREEITEQEVYKDCKEGEFRHNRYLIDWYKSLLLEDPDYLRVTDDTYVFQLEGMIGSGMDEYSGPVEYEIREIGCDEVLECKEDIFRDCLPIIEKKEATLDARKSLYKPDVHYTVWVPTVWQFVFDEYSGSDIIGYECDMYIEYHGLYDCNKIKDSVVEREKEDA